MDLWQLRCSRGDYEAQLVEGTPSLDQTFSDLNEDFAYYRWFHCPIDRAFHAINIHDRSFDGTCPKDGAPLQPVTVIPPTTCPRCGSTLSALKQPFVAEEQGE